MKSTPKVKGAGDPRPKSPPQAEQRAAAQALAAAMPHNANKALDFGRENAVTPPPGTSVGSLVAKGEVALGFQQLSEMTGVAGIDVIGGLPEAVQQRAAEKNWDSR